MLFNFITQLFYLLSDKKSRTSLIMGRNSLAGWNRFTSLPCRKKKNSNYGENEKNKIKSLSRATENRYLLVSGFDTIYMVFRNHVFGWEYDVHAMTTGIV